MLAGLGRRIDARYDEEPAPRAVVVDLAPVRRDRARLRKAAGVFRRKLVERVADVKEVALGAALAA